LSKFILKSIINPIKHYKQNFSSFYMTYDLDFYKAYSEYLVEERVRNVHDSLLNIFKTNFDFNNVVDFGCG